MILPPELAWLLRAVAGRVEPAAAPDAATVLELVRHHRLAPFLEPALAAPLPTELRHGLEAAWRQARLRGLRLSAELAGAVRALEAAGVEVMAIKGPALALLLHGDSLRRQCRDLDLLVRPEQADAALAVLGGRDYRPPDGETWRAGHEAPLRHAGGGPLIELHVRLIPEHRLLPLDAWSAADTVNLAGTAVRTLALPAAVIYAAAHGGRHLWNRLGWLTDIAAAARDERLDWSETLTLAEGLGVERQLALAAVLARDLLAAPLPPPLAPLAARAARAADVLAPAFTLPLVNDRQAIYRIGALRVMWWEAAQFHGATRWAALARHFRVTDGDRQAFPLPPWAEPLRPALRLWRIGGRVLRRNG